MEAVVVELHQWKNIMHNVDVFIYLYMYNVKRIRLIQSC